MSEKAGFCTVCNRSVYLTAEGGCVFGHGPEAVKGEQYGVQWEAVDAMGNCIPTARAAATGEETATDVEPVDGATAREDAAQPE